MASGPTDDTGGLLLRGVFIVGRQDGVIRVRLDGDDGSVLWEQTVSCNAEELGAGSPTAVSAVEDAVATPDAASEIVSGLVLLRHQSVCLLTVGKPAGLSELKADLATSPVTRGALTLMSVDTISDVPDLRRGLDSIDVLLIVSDYQFSQAQTQAVQDWVMTGGHLLVSCGERLPQLLASSAGMWLQQEFGIASGTENDLISSPDLSALQNYVAGAVVLQTNRENVRILRMTSDQPRILVNSINGPLISRRSLGAGLVTMVAVDLNAKPVNRWLALPQLYEMLLFSRLLDKTDEQSSRSGRISSTGVSDLSTQLAAVADAIPADQRWSSWHAMLLILVYLLIIGPLDYLLVVRLFRKPKLTWFTFPLLVASACLLTFWASASHRAEATLRQVALLDVAVDGTRHTRRLRSWNSLSTTDSRFARLAVKTPSASPAESAADSDTRLIWHGRAEDVFGGLYREGGAGLGRQHSRRTDIGASEFTAVPLIVDGSQAFLAESFSDTNTEPIFESELVVPASGLLEGHFTHHLPVPIENWAIMFGNRVYLPSLKADEQARQIAPGQPWSRRSGNVRVSELKDFLRGVRAVEYTPKRGVLSRLTTTQVQSVYNIQGTNPLDILLMISTYHATGGQTYVRLNNDYLRRDEVSDSLHLNTALMIGLADLPLTDLELDGTIVKSLRAKTVVRFFLPVQRNANADEPVEANTKAQVVPEPE